MKVVPTALVGLGIGLLIAFVTAFVNRGDISVWQWLFVAVIVSGLFLLLGGHLSGSSEE